MARTIRSEYAAHAAQLTRIQSRSSTAQDWRTVLASRDAKRAAYHARTVRRSQAGFIRTSCTFILSVCSALAYMAMHSV